MSEVHIPARKAIPPQEPEGTVSAHDDQLVTQLAELAQMHPLSYPVKIPK